MEAFAVVEVINRSLFQIYFQPGWSLKGQPLQVIGSAFFDAACHSCYRSTVSKLWRLCGRLCNVIVFL